MAKIQITSDEQAHAIGKAMQDPVFFFENILGCKIDEQQKQVIEAFPHHRRIAIKSGHSAGKDWLSARIALWFHVTHYPSIVVLTGPTDRQVKHVCWGELKAAHRQARYEIGGELLETQLKSGDPKHFIIGFTANSPEAFQGFHSENLLVIVTEAPGVEPRMWPGINSLMTSVGEARMLCIGNATYDPESEFYKMFTSSAELYKTFTLNSEKSSYCSKTWVSEMVQEHGVESAMYRARVLGDFPVDAADTLIPLGWIERAHQRWKETNQAGLTETEPVTLGVDVARFGSDMTVFILGRGNRFTVYRAVQGQDLMQTVGHVVVAMRDHNIKARDVRVDDTGLGGGVTDRLRELGHHIQAINFGADASDKEKFANARGEMFWALHERFREGRIEIDPKETKLVRDLSVLKYKPQSSGALRLEPKEETKKKLGYSPDYADALALACLPGAIADAVAAKGKANWGLLEYMRSQALQSKKHGVQNREAASVRGVASVPGAAEALRQEGVQDGRAKQIIEARRIGL